MIFRVYLQIIKKIGGEVQKGQHSGLPVQQ